MIRSQADQRRPVRARDQHGRHYFFSIEKASGYPTGIVERLFSAPVMAPQGYLRFNEQSTFTADRPDRVFIDYDTWISDQLAACKEWDDNKVRYGRSIHGTAFKASDPTTPELIALLGPRPAAVEPIIACRQGSRWALGLSKVKPPEAVKWFPEEDKAEALVFGDAAGVPVFSDEDEELSSSDEVVRLRAENRRLRREAEKAAELAAVEPAVEQTAWGTADSIAERLARQIAAREAAEAEPPVEPEVPDGQEPELLEPPKHLRGAAKAAWLRKNNRPVVAAR